jgi:restriction system protein
MAVPKYDELTWPTLAALSGGAERTTHEIAALLAREFSLSPEDQEARLPSGGQTYLMNRTGWAGFHIQKAGLVIRPRRSCWKITEAGEALLKEAPRKLDRAALMRFAAYREFMESIRKNASESGAEVPEPVGAEAALPPNERIEEAFAQLNSSLASELLEHMGKMDPFRFEQLVVDLLFAMGYGGSREEAAKVTKKSGDEGIDGIINEDRLGLDVIYVQAKRWQSSVGRREIQSFVGALAGQQAHKGVFITTSEFIQSAVEYARNVPQKIILIDGLRLAELMIEHNIGVTTTRTIALKRIDSDYFEE